MEQTVLKYTKRAINEIKKRANLLQSFVEYIEKVQPYIKLVKFDRILLIDKKYVDKIYRDSIQTDLLSLLKNKNEKTDLEWMLIFHCILDTVKKNSKKNIDPDNSPYEEIEAFYAYAKFEISFSKIYEKILETEKSTASTMQKLKEIYENCKYDNRDIFINNPDFESFQNTKEMYYQNGRIINELGEYLIIENYYCTNINLHPSLLGHYLLEGQLFSIKLTLEHFMPSLAQKAIKKNNANPYPFIQIERKRDGQTKSGTNLRLYIFFKFVNEEMLKKENLPIFEDWFGIKTERFQKNMNEIMKENHNIYKDPKYSFHAKKVKEWIEQTNNAKIIAKFKAAYPHLY